MRLDVTYHAVAQLAERHPDAPVRDREDFIRGEVRAALNAGRVGPKCPGCGYEPKRVGRYRSKNAYLVWTKDKRRCYVVTVTNSRRIVLTTMPPPAQEQVA